MVQKYARCHFFNEEGKSIRPGCPRSAKTCHFAHPEDPEWASLVRRGSKRASESKYSSSRHYPRDKSRSTSPRRSTRARSRTPPRGPTASQYRRASGSDPSKMDSQPSASGTSPRRSTRVRSRSPPREPSTAHYTRASGSDTPKMDSRPSASDSYQRASGPSFHSARLSSPPPPPPASESAPPSHAPPSALPVPPPPPPAFSSASTGTTKTELTQEEMRVQWDAILPLMADCVHARKEHQECLKELQDFERMLLTPRYMVLVSNTDSKRVDQQRAEMKARCDAKSRQVTAALEALKEINWWPVGPNGEEDAATKYQELTKYAMELNETAVEMYKAYAAAAHKPSAGTSAETAMDVDPPESSARPLKRRRLSGAVEDVSIQDGAELERIRDRHVDLEERIFTLRDDLVAWDDENQEDILTQVEAKWQSFSLQPSKPSHTSTHTQLEQSVSNTDKEIVELGKEVAALILQGEEVKSELEALKRGKAQDLEEMAALQQRLEAYEEASERDRKTMEALNAALAAYRDRPPSPPSLPLDFILRAIDEPVQDSVRSTVRPMVEDLKEKMVKQDAQTFDELWDRLALTFKVVDAVRKVAPVLPGRSVAAPS
ncbi:hypothetical protein B0H10DRAFT_1983231 [Mycena sp. CBHHK59/15]|nr:hypothetical protein B0H10DRAFT_1983231 [Mycena sp. CBHHK59/15]